MEIFLIINYICYIIILIYYSQTHQGNITMETIIAGVLSSFITALFMLFIDIRKIKDVKESILEVKKQINETTKQDLKSLYNTEKISGDTEKISSNTEKITGNIKKISSDTEKIYEVAINTEKLTETRIDPNVLKILKHSEYLYNDTEYKNKLSEEYKGKINRNLMISNIESVYDKIVDLEIEKSKMKDEFIKEKKELIKEKNEIISQKYSISQENKLLSKQIDILYKEIESLKIENEELIEELKQNEPQIEDRGFSR